MSKILATFAVGEEHQRYLDLALPGMIDYADIHGYELVHDVVPKIRPASWAKVPLLMELLQSHSEVLWVDCDVMIMRRDVDLASEVPLDCTTAMVTHNALGEGWVPNCGVWLVRSHALPWLERVLAEHGRYRDHPWWEQAAVIEHLDEVQTHWLDPTWNWHHRDRNRVDNPRFLHVTNLANRLEVMQSLAVSETYQKGMG